MPRLATFRTGFRASLALLSSGCLAAAMLTAEEQQPLVPKESPQSVVRTYLMKKIGKAPAGSAVPNKSPWVWCAEQYEAASKQDAKVMYGLIAEHLAIAEKRFLNSENADERRKGLGMVSEASQCASQRLKDNWLAVQICQAYMMPHFEAADHRHWKYLSRQNILEVMADVYAKANDPKQYIEIMKMLIDNAPNRNTADAARLRLAQMVEKQGDYKEALRLLKEIDPSEGIGSAKRLIPEIEKKLKSKS